MLSLRGLAQTPLSVDKAIHQAVKTSLNQEMKHFARANLPATLSNHLGYLDTGCRQPSQAMLDITYRLQPIIKHYRWVI
ncbi:hypothetical protein P4S72_12750 [Vibrio sp. PP-XX7]